MTNVRLRTGDAVERLGELDSESIDLTLFSPPYDSLRTYGGEYSFEYQRIGAELYRVSKPGAVAAVVIMDGTVKGVKSLTSFRMCLDWVDSREWNLWEHVIYHRHSPHNHVTRFRVDHENVFLFVKGNRPKWFDKSEILIPSAHAGKHRTHTKRNPRGVLVELKNNPVKEVKCPGTVWDTQSGITERTRKVDHPATFPDELARRVILAFSQPGETVLDPMVGSGTTCAVAAKNGRNSIGFDINPGYIELTRRRHREEGLIFTIPRSK